MNLSKMILAVVALLTVYTQAEGKEQNVFFKETTVIEYSHTVGIALDSLRPDSLNSSPFVYDEIIDIVEIMPCLKRCKNENRQDQRKCTNEYIVNFIKTHLRYPPEARLTCIEATAIVSFYIEKDGLVTSIELKRDPGFGLGEEAIRVINLLVSEQSIWEPGIQWTKPVRVQYNIPVRFKLD